MAEQSPLGTTSGTTVSGPSTGAGADTSAFFSRTSGADDGMKKLGGSVSKLAGEIDQLRKSVRGLSEEMKRGGGFSGGGTGGNTGTVRGSGTNVNPSAGFGGGAGYGAGGGGGNNNGGGYSGGGGPFSAAASSVPIIGGMMGSVAKYFEGGFLEQVGPAMGMRAQLGQYGIRAGYNMTQTGGYSNINGLLAGNAKLTQYASSGSDAVSASAMYTATTGFGPRSTQFNSGIADLNSIAGSLDTDMSGAMKFKGSMLSPTTVNNFASFQGINLVGPGGQPVDTRTAMRQFLKQNIGVNPNKSGGYSKADIDKINKGFHTGTNRYQGFVSLFGGDQEAAQQALQLAMSRPGTGSGDEAMRSTHKFREMNTDADFRRNRSGDASSMSRAIDGMKEAEAAKRESSAAMGRAVDKFSEYVTDFGKAIKGGLPWEDSGGGKQTRPFGVRGMGDGPPMSGFSRPPTGDSGSGGSSSDDELLKGRLVYSNQVTGVTNLNPTFKTKLAKMFRDNPKLRLTSGWRSNAEQTAAYNADKAAHGGKPSGRYATPGKSKHEFGLAADISPGSEYGWLKANAPKYGLKHPFKSDSHEPWHWELPGGGAPGGSGGDTGSTSGTAESSGGTSSGGESAFGGAAGGGGGPGLFASESGFFGSSPEAGALSGFGGGGVSGGGGGGSSSSGSSTDSTGSSSGSSSGSSGGGSTSNFVGTPDRQKWARDLLANLGFPATEENIKAISAWEQAEGFADGKRGGRYNPLNTTKRMPGSSNYNKIGVQNFKSYDDGVVANAKTITNGRYANIIAALKEGNSAAAVAKAVAASPWGTGHGVERVLGIGDSGGMGGGGGAISGPAVSIGSVQLTVKLDKASEQEAERLFSLFVDKLRTRDIVAALGGNP